MNARRSLFLAAITLLIAATPANADWQRDAILACDTPDAVQQNAAYDAAASMLSENDPAGWARYRTTLNALAAQGVRSNRALRKVKPSAKDRTAFREFRQLDRAIHIRLVRELANTVTRTRTENVKQRIDALYTRLDAGQDRLYAQAEALDISLCAGSVPTKYEPPRQPGDENDDDGWLGLVVLIGGLFIIGAAAGWFARRPMFGATMVGIAAVGLIGCIYWGSNLDGGIETLGEALLVITIGLSCAMVGVVGAGAIIGAWLRRLRDPA